MIEIYGLDRGLVQSSYRGCACVYLRILYKCTEIEQVQLHAKTEMNANLLRYSRMSKDVEDVQDVAEQNMRL